MHDWLMENGIWGVFLLMLAQNLLPLLPSEVIMPLAGFLATRGFFDLHAAILAGMAGSLLGHLPWYFLGIHLGRKRLEDFVARHGRWVRLRRVHLARAEDWFNENEMKAVFLGRLVPGLRTCVNIPAGVTRMAFLPFLMITVLGEAVWDTSLALGGYLLGRDYLLIAGYLHVLLLPIALALFAWLWLRRRRAAQGGGQAA
jgi:membrane protein DedA with SNARE-associated domain